MSVSSVLIGGGGAGGCAAAVALARSGVEVTLVERARRWPDAGQAIAVEGDGERMLAALGLPEGSAGFDAALVGWLREAGVEARADTELVGFVNVDRHVEAELSDGRVENYDVVVVAGEPWRLIASDEVRGSHEFATVAGALRALAS